MAARPKRAGPDLPSTKPLVEKLGLDKVNALRVVGDPALALPTFHEELAGLPGLTVTKTGNAWQACLLFIQKNAELGKLAALVKPLAAPRTFVWVVYPKAQKDPREADVRAAGLALGIVDVKITKFSETHTGLKFTARRA